MIPSVGMVLPRLDELERIRPLGAGAAAQVFLARWRHDDSLVVHKEIRVEGHGRQLVETGERIGIWLRRLEALKHPRLEPYLGSQWGDRDLHLFFRYLAGETLHDRLRRETRLPIEAVLPILEDLLDCLAYLHGQDLLHRDLKPANLLVTEDGRGLVLDLGLIKDLASPFGPTATGASPCTPMYAAPEVLSGRGADPASDLYAAGLVALRCLTGSLPGSGGDLQDLLRIRLSDSVPVLPDDLPAGLRELVLDLVARDPSARPDSAGIALERLRRWRDHVGDRPLPAPGGGTAVMAGVAPVPGSGVDAQHGAEAPLGAATGAMPAAEGRTPQRGRARRGHGRDLRPWLAAIFVVAVLGGTLALAPGGVRPTRPRTSGPGDPSLGSGGALASGSVPPRSGMVPAHGAAPAVEVDPEDQERFDRFRLSLPGLADSPGSARDLPRSAWTCLLAWDEAIAELRAFQTEIDGEELPPHLAAMTIVMAASNAMNMLQRQPRFPPRIDTWRSLLGGRLDPWRYVMMSLPGAKSRHEMAMVLSSGVVRARKFQATGLEWLAATAQSDWIALSLARAIDEELRPLFALLAFDESPPPRSEPQSPQEWLVDCARIRVRNRAWTAGAIREPRDTEEELRALRRASGLPSTPSGRLGRALALGWAVQLMTEDKTPVETAWVLAELRSIPARERSPTEELVWAEALLAGASRPAGSGASAEEWDWILARAEASPDPRMQGYRSKLIRARQGEPATLPPQAVLRPEPAR